MKDVTAVDVIVVDATAVVGNVSSGCPSRALTLKVPHEHQVVVTALGAMGCGNVSEIVRSLTLQFRTRQAHPRRLIVCGTWNGVTPGGTNPFSKPVPMNAMQDLENLSPLIDQQPNQLSGMAVHTK